MARIPWLMVLPPVLFLVLAGVFVFGLGRSDPNALPSTLIGREAPALALTPLADLPLVEASDLANDGVKIVNFWASWCAPCRVEHPNLMALAALGVKVYGVNYKDEPDKSLKFLEELGNPYAGVGQDASGRVAINWGVYGVPESYVIDRQGRVLLRFPGPLTNRVMEETILPAIESAERIGGESG